MNYSASNERVLVKKNNYLITLFKVLVSAATLTYCIDLINPGNLYASLSQASLWSLLFALAANFTGNIVCKAILIWKLINTNNVRVRLNQIISINLSMRFYTIFLPRIIVTGMRWNRYRKLSDGITSFTLLTFEATLTLFFLSIGAIFFYYLSQEAILPASFQISMISIALLFSLIVMCFVSKKTLSTLKNIFALIDNHKKIGALVRSIEKIFTSIEHCDLSNKSNMRFVFFLSSLNYLLFIVGAYFAAQSISLPLTIIEITWARSAILLIAHLPASIAGLGVRELGFVILFGYIGLTPDEAMSYALISFGIQVGIASIGAIIEFYLWLIKRDV